ncbi:MAG: hypothetical protein QOD73_2195, partial [Solirubrobacteraceae bacterium]|nr:hypothetical protein [Solirubrobacteraceae bacterium]
MSSDRKQAQGGLSAGTLMIASASSLVAALVVSKIWGGGTLIGAAVTPVIVALVSEGLRRPAQVVTTVRDTRSARFDPVEEGRRGLREGDLAQARRAAPGDPEPRFSRPAPGEQRTPRPPRAAPAAATDAARTPSRSPLRSRRAILAAIATGLIAFVVAGVLLTGSELVFGNSAVTSSSQRTTLLGGRSSTAKKTTNTDTTTTPTTTSTTPTTATTTTPATGTTTA